MPKPVQSDYIASLQRIKEQIAAYQQERTESVEKKMENKKVEKSPSTHRVDELV